MSTNTSSNIDLVENITTTTTQSSSSSTSSLNSSPTIESIELNLNDIDQNGEQQQQHKEKQEDLEKQEGEGEGEEEEEEGPRSLLISLLSELKIGCDLSRISLPTAILEPRSLLQKLTDNMIHGDILCNLKKMTTPIDRIKLLTKWYLSQFYFKPKGVKKPYNPILGEIFRSRWEFQESNSVAILVAEQISHHPPISCIYFSNRKDGYAMTGTITPKSKFMGTSMAVIVDGTMTLTILDNDKEEYIFTFPSAVARGIIFGTLLTEIVGAGTITCKQTNLKVEMDFKAKPMFGGEYNLVSGKIKQTNNNGEITHTFGGRWDKKVEITSTQKKKSSSGNLNSISSEILWECNSSTAQKKTKIILRPIEEQQEFESQRLWQKVTHAIVNKNQKDATFEKNKLEDEQRKRVRERKEKNIEWEPRLFKKLDNDQWVYKYSNLSIPIPNEPKEVETEGIIHFENQKPTLIEKCGASENEILIN